jgi:transcriptional regulator with XRE-family HTH domain
MRKPVRSSSKGRRTKMDQPIAQNVRRLREERQWTQAELSVAAGVDERTIQRAEAGQPLRVESLKSIAAAFNTTIERLSTSKSEALVEEIRKEYRLIQLRPVTTAADLNRFWPTDAYQFHREGSLSTEQADEVAALEQEIKDCGDLWRGLEPLERRDLERGLDVQLAALFELGVSVSAGTAKVRLTVGGRDDSLRIEVLYVAVRAGPTPLAALMEKKGPVSFQ